MFDNSKKNLFSGIQPSGIITLGNYIGALSNFVKMQDDYNCIYSIVDLHAITVRQDPLVLKKNSFELAALYIACGLNPEKCILFIQSHVSAHAELNWVLNTITYVGEVSRMTQYKDKSRKNADNINMGLMDYPVLQTADILLYNSSVVPIGADQKQHVELSRDLAIRFNGHYGDTFVVPEPVINKYGAKIMSLADPLKKMSKSDENINAFVAVTDDKDTIIRKFKRAVTDSDNVIKASKDKPGITNLLTIYSVFADKAIAAAEKEFINSNYGDFKLAVAESVIAKLTPIQEEYKRLLADKAYLNQVLINGAKQANDIARRTLSKVYKKIGFYMPEPYLTEEKRLKELGVK
ncbi:tryptophan--trna ligase mitochondrial [Holotrichia oblita]|nr:tryptophan--trna ligase mitochondrial [Holotrichia oblita]